MTPSQARRARRERNAHGIILAKRAPSHFQRRDIEEIIRAEKAEKSAQIRALAQRARCKHWAYRDASAVRTPLALVTP